MPPDAGLARSEAVKQCHGSNHSGGSERQHKREHTLIQSLNGWRLLVILDFGSDACRGEERKLGCHSQGLWWQNLSVKLAEAQFPLPQNIGGVMSSSFLSFVFVLRANHKARRVEESTAS